MGHFEGEKGIPSVGKETRRDRIVTDAIQAAVTCANGC